METVQPNLSRDSSAWSAEDEALLRRAYGKTPTPDLAQKLGRTTKAVRSRAKVLKIRTRSFMTEAEMQTIREMHGKRTARQIADVLGCKVARVHNACFRLGLGRGKRIYHGPEFDDFCRQHAAQGWSDTEIADAYSAVCGHRVERRTVADRRGRFGIPSQALSEHRRQRVAERTKEQLAKAGLPSIGYLRVEAFKKFARDSGWPEDLQKRETQILNLMWERGPMTKREIVDALGMPWKGSRKSLCGNRAGGSYLATLMRRGMVVRLGGKIVRHRDCGKGNRAGQGKNVALYSLSPDIQRRKVEPHVATQRNQRPQQPACVQAPGGAGRAGVAGEPDGTACVAQVVA